MREFPKLLTVAEVAATLRITPETVRSLIRRGVLPGSQIGHVYRIPEAEFARFLNVEPEPEPELQTKDLKTIAW